MRAELIGNFEPCMTEIYLHIDARMADYIHTHPQPSSAHPGQYSAYGRTQEQQQEQQQEN